jgi:hypothetical protein
MVLPLCLHGKKTKEYFMKAESKEEKSWKAYVKFMTNPKLRKQWDAGELWIKWDGKRLWYGKSPMTSPKKSQSRIKILRKEYL